MNRDIKNQTAFLTAVYFELCDVFDSVSGQLESQRNF